MKYYELWQDKVLERFKKGLKEAIEDNEGKEKEIYKDILDHLEILEEEEKSK